GAPGLAPVGVAAAYENRRYRHSATALGIAAHELPGALFFERRLGLIAGAISVDASGRARVLYPSDGGFPPAPAGAPLASTARSLDLLARPLFTYELGRIFQPVLIRLELEPELRWNPWPGARAVAGVILPLQNDFGTD